MITARPPILIKVTFPETCFVGSVGQYMHVCTCMFEHRRRHSVVSLIKTQIICLVLIQPRKASPDMTDKSLNQNKNKNKRSVNCIERIACRVISKSNVPNLVLMILNQPGKVCLPVVCLSVKTS